MAVFTYTQSDVVLGKLTNGNKIVHTILTITNNGTDATTITILPLQRVIAFTVGLALPATDTFEVVGSTTVLNKIVVTPVADATNDVLHIFSVGV
jgi:hypothetical protein